MDILIRGGMEMPTSCAKCKIKNAIECNRWQLVRSVVLDRHRDCPLVSVSPHGDLIDRDALPTGRVEWEDIVNAPVIIPADEPKEE